MTDNAVVYYKEKKAGLLKKTEDVYEFEYDSDYLKDADAKPVSLTMPLTQKNTFLNVYFPFSKIFFQKVFFLI